MSLTVVVPVWKRELHALRLLWHLDRIALPYPVIVADGGDNPLLRRLLANKARFPRLTSDYFEYDDKTFADFSFKMSDAFSKARSPYVMILDEDDFCLPSGLSSAVEFLDANADYACCGGGNANFVIGSKPPVPGLETVLGNWFAVYGRRPFSGVAEHAEDTARERVFNYLKSPAYTYYSVHRKDNAVRAFAETATSEIADSQLWEVFFSTNVLISGKSKGEGAWAHYARQRGTSSDSSQHADFCARVVEEGWHQDLTRFLRGLAASIADSDGISRDGLEAALRDTMVQYFRNREQDFWGACASASANSDSKRFVKHYLRPALKCLVPETVRRMVRTAEDDRKSRKLRQERRATLGKLRAYGASAAYLEELNREFDDIEETLTGDGFVEFLRNTAPECLAETGPSAA